MPKLLRHSHLPSYFPLSQDTHIDDGSDPGKETVQPLGGQEKRHLWSYWLQHLIIILLLSLAGTAGFFIGRSLPPNRLASSTLPDTVPQGSLDSRIPRMRPADCMSSSLHRLVRGDVPI